MNRLLLMVLAVFLNLITVSELRAEKICNCGKDNPTDCCWEIKNGTLFITGTGDMRNYGYSWDESNRDINNGYPSTLKSGAPWAHLGITQVVVGNGISSIGDHAFAGESNITKVEGMDNIKKLGSSSFYLASSLTSIDMPNVEEIGIYVFYYTPSLTYVGFNSDKITSWGDENFYGSRLSQCNKTGVGCGSCGNGYVMSGLGCVSDCGAGYLGKDGRCIDASLGCGAGYRQIENWCNRIQYTPAEAAPLLKDDDNFVILTFKK